MLGSAENEYFCHGDLHLDNVIYQGKRCLAIGPKGIMGEMAFEAAAFDPPSEGEKQNLDQIISLLKPKASILDLGCGTGEPIARYLSEHEFIDPGGSRIALCASGMTGVYM